MNENGIIPAENIIVDGGDPLPICPKSWEEAYALEAQMNEGKEENAEPFWDFDCGFKLDFDGPLVKISSRFYPPKTHYGPTWDGTVTIYVLDKELSEKKFDCKTLDELRREVEEYVFKIANKIMDALK